MNEASQDKLVARQEHLQKLGSFCQSLHEALAKAGLSPEQILGVFRTGLEGECVVCGGRVSGEELFALSQPPSADRASAKVGRLRRGDCACKGCNSFYYRLSFCTDRGVDWTQIFSEADAIQREKTERATSRDSTTPPWTVVLMMQVPRYVWVGLGAFMLLLFLRHWYIGGSIPLVRAPEQFQVDPEPAGAEEGSSKL